MKKRRRTQIKNQWIQTPSSIKEQDQEKEKDGDNRGFRLRLALENTLIKI